MKDYAATTLVLTVDERVSATDSQPLWQGKCGVGLSSQLRQSWPAHDNYDVHGLPVDLAMRTHTERMTSVDLQCYGFVQSRCHSTQRKADYLMMEKALSEGAGRRV